MNKHFDNSVPMQKVGWMTGKKFCELMRRTISKENPIMAYISLRKAGSLALSMSFPCVDIQFAYARPDYCFLLKGEGENYYINAGQADRTVSQYLHGQDTVFHFSAGDMDFWLVK